MELPTACSALVGEHATKLSVCRTGNALAKRFGDASVGILRPRDGAVFRDKTPREFMVAVCALIRQTFLEPSSKTFPLPTLCLGKTLFRLAQFVRMRNLLARRERQKGREARVDTDGAMPDMRDSAWLCVDDEAEIPARSALDDTSTLDCSSGNILRVEADTAEPWYMDTWPHWRPKRVWKRNAGQLITLSFEAWSFGDPLKAPLPGYVRRIKHALQGMTWDAELFAMVSKQVSEAGTGIIDAVLRIGFDLSDSPIPHTCQAPEPVLHGLFLRAVEPKLELSLDHATPVSGFRCTA